MYGLSKTRDLTPSIDIRTYSVVPLNEECGLIEWVRNTVAMRALLKRRYDTIGLVMMVRKF
jgi:serine/threonine-protein kinase ATR